MLIQASRLGDFFSAQPVTIARVSPHHQRDHKKFLVGWLASSYVDQSCTKLPG